jgi:nucleoside-diphosphate-sugar epimerase
MKKILITGSKGYIGTSLCEWLGKYPDEYLVKTISLKSDSWKNVDFSSYDVVFHAAGIAHIKEKKENTKLYYKVNRDLTFELAEKAKNDGVKQFIFLSSMSVYGIENGKITNNSQPNPNNNYGKSKYQAENLIQSLKADTFKITILRPPMVYGKGCKGNYQRLARFALSFPFFPDIQNKRSMIFISNLCEFIRLLIDDSCDGIFLPQNKEYICTSDLVRMIAKTHGKNIIMVRTFDPFIKIINLNIVKKIFGNLYYEQTISNYKHYHPISFEETIKLTEK